MKNLIDKPVVTALTLAGLLGVTPLAVSSTHGSDSPPEASTMGPGMPGPGMSMMPMMSQMRQMHEEMSRLGETKDPAARREILEQHLQSMGAMMQMMHGMMAGQGIMGHHRGERSRMGQGETMAPECPMGGPRGAARAEHDDMVSRMYMMEQRLNLMQLMMDEMLKNQSELLEAR